MQKSDATREAILQQRDAWYPCLRWIEEMVRKRMSRGRKFLVENPWPSELWETLCMDKLISEAPCDAESREVLELVRGDQCEFGLRDLQNGMPHFKPTGVMTASKGVKDLRSSSTLMLWQSHPPAIGGWTTHEVGATLACSTVQGDHQWTFE